MKEFTLQKYRDMSAILSDTFGYVRIHYKSLGKGLLLFVLPFYIISGVLVGTSYSNFFVAIFENPQTTDLVGLGYEFWVGILLLMLSSGTLLTITLKHIDLAREGTEIETTDLLENFGWNLLSLIGLYFIVSILVGFSLLLLIIPGIYVGIKLFVSPAVLMLEKRDVFDSISRSWNLVEGHWWFTFAVYLVMYFITSFMSYVLIIPFMILIGFMTASGMQDGGASGLGSVMGAFYSLFVILASLFSVLVLISMALHYFNLVERKEGKGLKAQIEELG